VRDRKGKPAGLWVGGTQLLPREAMLAEARQRYRKAAAS
jgi:D-alanyl-D-alanine carboxypeptidase